MKSKRGVLAVALTAGALAFSAAPALALGATAAAAPPARPPMARQTTQTTLTLLTNLYPLREEDRLPFTVRVTTFSGNIPTGVVTVNTGSTTLCTATLANGTGTCALTPSQLPVGDYQVTATYAGNSSFASSTSTPVQTLHVINPQPTTSTLTESTDTITVGQEQAETFNATVTAPNGQTPTGTVAVDAHTPAGALRLCVFTINNGTGKCTLAANQIPAGSYPITAFYAGRGNDFTPSFSNTLPLTVLPG